jgi:microcystin-dependent protein
MACSNCFNGCTEIISDQCVRYTGNNIPALDISTNDSLAEVESKIVTYILDLGTGTGIVPVIDTGDLCALVSGFLPGSGTITLNDVISALLQSVCTLKGNVDVINSTLTTLNANYTIGCLSGVTASSDTHDVLQAAITKLCATDASLAAVISNLPINYVQLANLNNLIQQYIDSPSYTPPTATKWKDRMVPYVAYEYYAPSLAGQFDSTGAGIGDWEKVYLCNGRNGTPDKRGRVAAGTTDGSMLGLALPSTVNPSTPGNPTYTLQGTAGANSITLTELQMPGHTHTATAISTADPHSHFIARNGSDSGSLSTSLPLDTEYDVPGTFGPERFSYRLRQTLGTADVGPTSPSTVNVNTSVTINPKGGGEGHPNVQPTIGAYFIIYIP